MEEAEGLRVADEAEGLRVAESPADTSNSSRGNLGSTTMTYLRELKITITVSLSFMMVYTAYLAIQNLQSSLNQEAGLGVVSLGCLYGSIILSGILTPFVMRFIGAKTAMICAWVAHCIYTASNFYPTWGTLVPASVLLGILAAPLWTAQGLYITANSIAYAEIHHETTHAVLSRTNAFFFTCYESTQITGNLISSLVLHRSDYATNTTDSVKICGADDCPMSANVTVIQEPETHIVFTLLGIFLVFDVLGLIITAVLLPPLKNKDALESKDVKKSLQSCFSALGDWKLVLLIPFFVMQTMDQAIFLTEYTKAFVSCSLGIQMVGFVMAVFGASTVVTALPMGYLAKYTGRHVLFALTCSLDMSILLTMFFWKPSTEEKAVLFILPILMGVGEGIWQTQSNSLVAIVFPEKKDAAFANYHTWKAMGFAVTFIYSSFLCLRTKLLIAICMLVTGSVTYAIVEVSIMRTKKKLKAEPDYTSVALREDNNAKVC
ncbi:hypothetical protein ScPMuIL_006101 [Solemya velum]